MDRKQLWWCPKHKCANDFDGLYVTHQPGEGHQQWLERRRQNKRNHKAAKANNGNNTSGGNPSTTTTSGLPLTLNDQMRHALLTHHGLMKSRCK